MPNYSGTIEEQAKKRRDYNNRYYAEHPEYRDGRSVYIRKYRAKNLEALRSKERARAQLYKEQKREYDKIYRLTPKKRFSNTLCNARYRKLDFTLTFDEFMLFWKKPCAYCGDEIETVNLDRIDNAKGYTIDNVASCCATCNMMKRTMGAAEFIRQCRKIVIFNEENSEVKQ